MKRDLEITKKKFLERTKKIFKIEFLLLSLSVFCLITVFHFKNLTEKKFYDLDLEISSLTVNNNRDEMLNFFYRFEVKFESLCFFDEEIRSSLTNLEQSKSDFKNEFIIFQNHIKLAQKKLLDGHNSLLLCCFFIFAISIFVMVVKFLIKNSELEKIKFVTENQKTISRELHDTVAQNLAALKVYIQNNDNEKAEYFSTQALNDVRYLIGSMHCDFSEDFETVLKKMLQIFELNYKIKTRFFTASNSIKNLDSKNQIEIYRIFQEVLSNTARHSQATVLTVRITDLHKKFRIIFNDNGIGIKDSDFEKENHFGIKNIKDRVKNLNGEIEFTNGSEGGLTIAITIKTTVR